MLLLGRIDADFPPLPAKALYADAHTSGPGRVSCNASMSATLWIALGAAAVLALVYVLGVRVLYRQSREVDEKIDFTKIKPLRDEDGKD